MASHVFTYGSLMFAPVWQQVVCGSYCSQAASLSSHRRYALADDTYPGMVEETTASVDGLVYFDVSDADVVRLDDFEGAEYRRLAVTLTLDDGQALQAQTYLFMAVHRLSAAPWNPDAFALERFMASYCSDKLGR